MTRCRSRCSAICSGVAPGSTRWPSGSSPSSSGTGARNPGARRPARGPRRPDASAPKPVVRVTPVEVGPDNGFVKVGVPAPLAGVLAATGVTDPFSIQAVTLPDSMAGRDVLGQGRTGSGKTIAFALPLVARLAATKSPRQPNRPRALVLVPTRELASQVAGVIEPLAVAVGLRVMTIFGGVGFGPQRDGLARGTEIVVACPGRLIDLMSEGDARLDRIEITVIDEADHMADQGFLPMVKRILDATPKKGQRMLFSATLAGGVDAIVDRYLTDPVSHAAEVEAPVLESPVLEAPAPVAAAPMAARDCFGLPPDVRSTGVDFPIQFNVGSAVISPASESTLNLIAKSLALNERCIIVEGHTDASGNYDRNLMLSRERAESVINFLTSRSGIDRKRLVPVGKGSSDPLRSLDARDPKNRRVVFKVVTG